jgi:hypothetical protein
MPLRRTEQDPTFCSNYYESFGVDCYCEAILWMRLVLERGKMSEFERERDITVAIVVATMDMIRELSVAWIARAFGDTRTPHAR